MTKKKMMNWRNPEKELPKDGEYIWIMLEPHKQRGGLKESSASIQIVCGEVSHPKNHSCRVENYDELGMGSIGWYLGELPEDFTYNESYGIAWLPLDEMIYPDE